MDHLGAPHHVERPQLLPPQPHHRRPPHGGAQLHTKVEAPPLVQVELLINFSFLFMRDRVWLFGAVYCSINNFISYLTVSARLKLLKKTSQELQMLPPVALNSNHALATTGKSCQKEKYPFLQ